MLCKCSGKYIDIYFILKITFSLEPILNFDISVFFPKPDPSGVSGLFCLPCLMSLDVIITLMSMTFPTLVTTLPLQF